MTRDEFKKELMWRFHITSSGEKQLDKLIQELDPVIIEKEKVVYKKKLIYKKFKRSPVNIKFDPLLKRICLNYRVLYHHCFTNNRNKKVVAAKAHFCRQVKLENPKITATELSKYLNCHYSSILNLLESPSIKCSIEPIVKYETKNTAA